MASQAADSQHCTADQYIVTQWVGVTMLRLRPVRATPCLNRIESVGLRKSLLLALDR